MSWLMIFFVLFFSFSGHSALESSSLLHQTENAPQITSESELPKLVKHLTHNLQKDEDKAYALLLWIAQNIDYDDYKKNQVDKKEASRHSRVEIPKSGDILKTRLGVCKDIAILYKKMLEQADMSAKTINGCIEQDSKKKNPCKNSTNLHTWNAVWINNQWELVDPTWAINGDQKNVMGDISKKRIYEKELKKREKKSSHNYEPRKNRSVEKKWFMTSPEEMRKKHQPNDEKWRLINKKDRQNKNL